MMSFSLAADPPQHEVDRRDELNFYRVRVQRVFSGRERCAPDTAVTGLDLFAVAERFAGCVVAGRTVIRDNDAYVTDRNQCLGLNLHRTEPAVDEERAVGEHLQLLTALAAERQEGFRILEVIVIVVAGRLDFRRDDFSGADRRSVLYTDNAD